MAWVAPCEIEGGAGACVAFFIRAARNDAIERALDTERDPADRWQIN